MPLSSPEEPRAPAENERLPSSWEDLESDPPEANSEDAAEDTPVPPPLDSPQQNEAAQEAAQTATEAAQGRKSGGADWLTTSLGLLFWVVMLGIWLVPKYLPNTANILLEVSPDERQVISGVVLHQGKNVPDGSIRLVFDEPRTSRHLGSFVLQVKDGRFSSEGKQGLAKPDPHQQVRITANYWGSVGLKNEAVSVQGSTVVYTNCTAPLSPETLWGTCIVALVATLGLVMLFTGNLTRRKAELLFGVTYCFSFLSVTLPVVGLIVVSQNPYLIEMMKDAPIGLVRAKTKALESPQWLLNVGGVVTEPPQPVVSLLPVAPKAPANQLAPSPAIVASPTPSAEPAEKVAVGPPAPSAAAIVSDAPVDPAPAPEPLPKATEEAAPALSASVAEGKPHVEGGLAIPFYVLILAVFGSGINMMRRVPAIQAAHVQRLPESPRGAFAAALRIPVALFAHEETRGSKEEHQLGCDIRQQVIEQYMYLLSAPFLAIAVYYLLQVIAANISEPVLVLMSFSAGLISETIVSALIEFAERTLGQQNNGEKHPPEPTATT